LKTRGSIINSSTLPAISGPAGYKKQSGSKTVKMRSSFLVLQGTASPFFSQLAAALRQRGHAVRKVNFCGGDLLYGGKGGVFNYTDRAELLREWYQSVTQADSTTDVLMFGDCRAIHLHMHPVSQASGLRVHVFEEGYVRPHWITMERHGVNGRSQLPRDPFWYLERRAVTPQHRSAQPTGYSTYVRAFHDISYRAANTLHKLRFPHYQSHRPKNGLVEYTGLAMRALCVRHYERHADVVVRELLDGGRPFYLFPLQLNADSQIVFHSPFSGVRESLEITLRSFARHAPSDSNLVIKNHPLDTGLVDYRRYVHNLARELDIKERVVFIDAGHLPTLLHHARGVVVVNSTTGVSALYHKRPVITLGTAIYDMPGLTWQHGIDLFWENAQPPEWHLYQAFLDYVVHHTQINGDFYTKTGIAMAVKGAVQRLEAASHA
jgi:capsular polysaccharide export protein